MHIRVWEALPLTSDSQSMAPRPAASGLVCPGNLECCAVLSHSVVSNSLQPYGLYPTWLLCLWGFSRQEYWSGLPCPPPEGLPNPGIKPRSPALWVDSLPWATGEAQEPIRNTNAQAPRPTESETVGVVFPEIHVLMTQSPPLNTMHRICIFRRCWYYLSLDHSLGLLVYTTVF